MTQRTKQLDQERAEALAERDAGRQEAARARAVSSEASDELLDEIDAVLEETAFQREYRQKGGE